jgi:hypothetical protein
MRPAFFHLCFATDVPAFASGMLCKFTPAFVSFNALICALQLQRTSLERCPLRPRLIASPGTPFMADLLDKLAKQAMAQL